MQIPVLAGGTGRTISLSSCTQTSNAQWGQFGHSDLLGLRSPTWDLQLVSTINGGLECDIMEGLGVELGGIIFLAGYHQDV